MAHTQLPLVLAYLFIAPIAQETTTTTTTTTPTFTTSVETDATTMRQTTPEPTPEPEPPTGEWCFRRRTFISHYNYGSNKFYATVDRAKTACEKDDECGAVGLDLIPYREFPGGPVVHAHTIYHISAQEVLTNRPQFSYRYRSYLKGPCKSRKDA